MESNDTLLTATQTDIGSGNIGEFTFTGNIGDNPDIGSADDVDLFELELSENTGVFFDINASDVGSTLDPILRVFDADGNELAQNDDSGSLDSFIGFRPPAAGNYFVGVSGFSNFGYNPSVAGSTSDSSSTGDYELVITTAEINELSGGAQLLRDINTGSYSGYYGEYPYGSSADDFTEFNGQLFFTANDGENGNELWVSDGTESGTQLLVDIRPGSSDYGYVYGSYADDFTEFNGQLFFTANDGETGNELWVSDGTESGTQLLVDIRPGSSDYGYVYGSYANDFTEFNGQLFFTANDGENGNELWVSDGTAAGTQLLVDIRPGSSDYGYIYGSYAYNFTEFDGQLFFTANNGETGNELWVSDGTAAGTQLLVDINPGSYSGYYGEYPYSSYADDFTEFNGQLFFTANDGENGNELWVSDGTAAGTQLLVDIRPGSSDYGYVYGSYADDFTEFNGQLFFTANDGENGNELWVSDGTAAGTQLLVDINPGSSYGYYGGSLNSSYADDFTEFNGQLFFTAIDGENGNELWVSDGTAAGTQLLVDINPTNGGYYYGGVSNLTVADDLLFFTATDAFNGQELWVTDGTTEGTQLFQDINPGSDSSYPGDLTVVGDQLFFTANDGTTGNELWVATIPDNIISGDETNNRLDGTADIDLINGFDGNDRLIGRGGDDVINGGAGRDNISGNSGADLLTGGADNDRIVGGSGDDTIIGGTGDDTLTGARGADIFVFEADLLDGQSDTDRIRNFRSDDLLDFTDYLGAGGSIESTRVNSSLLSLDLGDEDILNIAGNQSGLDAAELQLEALA